MAISGQESLRIGATNQPTGSDDLYTAFNKIQNNFTRLFNLSSQYTSFASSNDGSAIEVFQYPDLNTVNFMNAGVVELTAGTGIQLSPQQAFQNDYGKSYKISIDPTLISGGGGALGVTSINVQSSTLDVSAATGTLPITSSGSVVVELKPIPTSGLFTPGEYISPTLTVDNYGRITRIKNTIASGTVTSVNVTSSGSGLSISGGPITSSGTITITNTGVTKLNAGAGIALSSSTGAVTISSTTPPSVTQVNVTSTNLNITGSPITSIGTIAINMPDSPTFSGNMTVGNLNINGAGSNALYVTGSATIAQDLHVGGNLYVPNLISVNSTTLNVQDPLLYLAANSSYPYNYDIGIYSHFATSGLPPGNGYQHTGLIRNHNNNIWYLFSNTAEPTGGTINFADANLTYDALKLGNITSVGNIVSLNANLGNLVTANYTTAVLTTAAQPNITSTGTLVSVSVTGNANIGNLRTAQVLASANITTPQFISNVTTGTAPLVVTSTTQVANLSVATAGSATTAGTVTTNAQPNITTVGTLGNLSVTSNVSSGNLSVTTKLTTGNITTTNGIFWANGAPYSPPAPNILMATITANNAVATTTVTSINIDGAVSYTGNVLIFDNVAVDTETGYSTSNGKYTPTVAGYYQIETSFSPYVVSFGSGTPPSSLLDGTLYFVVLVKNGTTVVGIGEQVGGGLGYSGTGFAYTGFTQSSINTVVRMNGTTDYLQVFLVAIIKSGSFTTGNLMSNYLQAIWLRS
jgi:hypothetical protein